MKKLMCFVTVIDLRLETAGAVINDLKLLRCLRKFGKVDVVSLQKKRFKSTLIALPHFFFQVFGTFARPYELYISRGLVASFVLLLLRLLHRKKVVHRNLFGASFASSETKYLFRETRYVSYIRFGSLLRHLLYRFIEKTILLSADAVTVATPEYADELVQIGVKPDRIKIIPFYVEKEFFQQPFSSNTSDTFTFGYAGNFQPYHELLPLVEAFELVSRANKKIRLVLVGDGPLRPWVEAEVKSRRLTDKVKFSGRVPHKALPSILSKFDAFVVLIRTTGISTSLLEAAAAGKVIITYKRENDPALSRFFKHMQHIYMVESLSAAKIAATMQLICSDSKLRKALSKGARQVAQEYFSEEYTIRHVQQLMCRVLRDCSIPALVTDRDKLQS